MSAPAPYPAYDDTAHCRLPGVDRDRFHPPVGTDSHTHSNTKKLCTGGGKVPACPFLEPCREYGLTHAVSGIWGGHGERERRRIREARRIVPEPLSMASMAAAPRSEQPRPDWFALRACDVCGQELRPKNLPRHRREQHGVMAS
jgi:hypothetical protein